MSAAEFGRWINYFNKNGRCGLVRMFDQGAALVAWKIDHIYGGTTQISDYLKFPREQDRAEVVASVKEIFDSFGGVKRRG